MKFHLEDTLTVQLIFFLLLMFLFHNLFHHFLGKILVTLRHTNNSFSCLVCSVFLTMRYQTFQLKLQFLNFSIVKYKIKQETYPKKKKGEEEEISERRKQIRNKKK
jgi:hypothetical protein